MVFDVSWNTYSTIMEHSDLLPPRKYDKMPLEGYAITIPQNPDDITSVIKSIWNPENNTISCDNDPYVNVVEDVTEIDIAYDQINRLNVMWVADGELFLYWYDAVASGFVTTNFGLVDQATLFMDDIRFASQADSTIWLVYTRESTLFARKQSDRFSIEYTIAELLPSERLRSIGMNKNYRLQIAIGPLTAYEVGTSLIVVDGKNVLNNSDYVGVKI